MKGLTGLASSSIDTDEERTALRDILLCHGIFMPYEARANYVRRQLRKLSDACVLRHCGNRHIRPEARRRNLL